MLCCRLVGSGAVLGGRLGSHGARAGLSSRSPPAGQAPTLAPPPAPPPRTQRTQRTREKSFMDTANFALSTDCLLPFVAERFLTETRNLTYNLNEPKLT